MHGGPCLVRMITATAGGMSRDRAQGCSIATGGAAAHA